MRFRPIGLCVAVAFSLSLLASRPALANGATDVRVQCAEGRAFLLRLYHKQAKVLVGNRRLDLRRKPSPLGRYYSNAEAALIVDGDFVAFVPKKDRQWRNCRIDVGAMRQIRD
ncbi:hypothetical protein LL251_10170 [Sphingobium naphthae]|nr:hypothetical protein [Sphingobium naphthae]